MFLKNIYFKFYYNIIFILKIFIKNFYTEALFLQNKLQ